MSPFLIELSIEMLVKLCALLSHHLFIGLAYEFRIKKQDYYLKTSLNFTELYYICNSSKPSTADVKTNSWFLYVLTLPLLQCIWFCT